MPSPTDPEKGVSGLPDLGARLGLQIICVARGDAERLVPCVDVAHRADDAPARRAVRIARYLLLDRILALLRSPRLRESQEKALIAGQPVDHRRGLAAQQREDA